MWKAKRPHSSGFFSEFSFQNLPKRCGNVSILICVLSGIRSTIRPERTSSSSKADLDAGLRLPTHLQTRSVLRRVSRPRSAHLWCALPSTERPQRVDTSQDRQTISGTGAMTGSARHRSKQPSKRVWRLCTMRRPHGRCSLMEPCFGSKARFLPLTAPLLIITACKVWPRPLERLGYLAPGNGTPLGI